MNFLIREKLFMAVPLDLRGQNSLRDFSVIFQQNQPKKTFLCQFHSNAYTIGFENLQGVPERSIRSKLAVPTIEGALWQKVNDRKEG